MGRFHVTDHLAALQGVMGRFQVTDRVAAMQA
jgi:hypothetical protein